MLLPNSIGSWRCLYLLLSSFIFLDVGLCGSQKTTLVKVQSSSCKIVLSSLKLLSIEYNELSSAKSCKYKLLVLKRKYH